MILIAKAVGKAPTYKLDIQDAIFDFNGSPHRMIKMAISGSKFPIRNAPIFVRIVQDKRIIEVSWLVEMTADEDKIIAFFPIDFAQKGSVEFGYGDEIMGIFAAPKWTSLINLDERLIEKDVITVNHKWIKQNTGSNNNSTKK